AHHESSCASVPKPNRRLSGEMGSTPDAETVRKYVYVNSGMFTDSTLERRAAFARLERKLEAILEFEKQHGEGSFLNLEHPFVQKSVDKKSSTFSSVKIANALNARPLRDKLIQKIEQPFY
ncbi:hypothetical protein AAAK29_31260, partial [Mesorhizobium sp. CCNWLW179-1]|uniref:hypothetical protein n=1 Tax=unclassified Mesorhizobium TaxID=325217 RepID=UPI00301429DC